jgi:hypothetical protein
MYAADSPWTTAAAGELRGQGDQGRSQDAQVDADIHDLYAPQPVGEAARLLRSYGG